MMYSNETFTYLTKTMHKQVIFACALLSVIAILLGGVTLAHAFGGEAGGEGGPGGGGGSCFPAGTQITLADGSTKNIEDVVVGDVVRAFNMETRTFEAARVLELESPIREGYWVINNGLLRMTNEHPLFIQKPDGTEAWGAVDPDFAMRDSALDHVIQLEIGDAVYTEDKGWVAINSLSYVAGELQTYNLKTVENHHTFFADGVLAHNKGGDTGGSSGSNNSSGSSSGSGNSSGSSSGSSNSSGSSSGNTNNNSGGGGPTSPAPTCTLGVSPASVQQGNGSTLFWNTTNASAIWISSIGNVSLNGNQAIFPNTTTTYTATVSGPGGTNSCSTTLTVTPPPPAPTCGISVSPNAIQHGNSSTLSWSSSNATSATINQGIGSVGVNGSQTISPSSSGTYSVTVSGPGGSKTCSVGLNVSAPPTPPPTPTAPSCTLSANPGSVQQGNSSSLSWSTSNASSFSISSIGSVALNGNQSVSPNATQTYTGTVSGPGGTNSCQATVAVTPPPSPTAPSCTISASPSTITSGNSTTLSWSSSNATSLSINQGIGSVATTGTQSVSPGSDVTYTVTVTNASGSATCQTAVDVNSGGGGTTTTTPGGGGGIPTTPDVTISSLSQPGEQPLASVFLSQVPYTGFTIAPEVFYGLLVLWSALLTFFFLWTTWGRAVGALPLRGIRAARTVFTRTARTQHSFVTVGDAPFIPTYEQTQYPYETDATSATQTPNTYSGDPVDVIEDAAQGHGAMIERAAAADILSRADNDINQAIHLLTRIIAAVGHAPSESWTLVTQDRVAEALDQSSYTTVSSAVDTEQQAASESSAVSDFDAHNFITAVLAGDEQHALRTVNACPDAASFMRAVVGEFHTRAKSGGLSIAEEVLIEACIETLEGHYSTPKLAAKAMIVCYGNGAHKNSTPDGRAAGGDSDML